ncbi:MAG: N-acetylgalactosamine-6-sulfatase, partial [Planctomycetota bacterium]|nr:N-acetylgalactosamine-6-sulfatase [Planctomycetota bacterium]
FKTMLYEGGVRSPLVVWGPGLINAGKAGTVNRTSVMAAIDLVPSLLALAGAQSPDEVAFDGQALSEVLTGKSTASRKGSLFFRRPPDRHSFYGVTSLPDLAVRNGRWKLLCAYDGSDPQLYDLEADPGETKNIAVKHPIVVRRLSAEVVAWHKSMPPDNGPTYRRQKATGSKKTKTPQRSSP